MAIAAMSVIFKVGFVGVSNQINLDFSEKGNSWEKS
jgi:hypothetical protein